MIPVSSSNLKTISYDPSSKNLLIEFHSGTYAYSEIPQHIYEGLLTASSKGKYHRDNIKGSYPCIKMS
ncbi:KTSC domain-containing protein [Gottschalkia acidurici]|uniref:KTSC domain-containing protein n=1 Tax=Clostridium acidurici TaxID=1556 RepID=UPI00059FC8D2|nr:KTSC domain-containing protein [Gottschalkia acidurici]